MTRDGNSPNGENLEESPHRQLRMRDVTDRTTLSPQTIHRMIGSGDFPLGVLDGGCRLWHVRSIKSWIWCRAQASWARRRLTDDPVFEPWSPEMERDDVPDVRLVKRVEALALVGLAKTTFLHAQSWTWPVVGRIGASRDPATASSLRPDTGSDPDHAHASCVHRRRA